MLFMIKYRNLIGFFLCFLFPFAGTAQKIATISIDEVANSNFGYPVSLDLLPITDLPDSVLSLVDITSGEAVSVPFQLDNLNGRKLYWMISPNKNQSSRTFELWKKPDKKSEDNFLTLKTTESALVIMKNGTDLWQYNQGVAYPPEGVDEAYARSGFVHPMRTPEGNSLTRIQPPDHYHHYGL